MKAIVQTAYGAPDDVLELREITPVVDSTFPLSEVAEAIRHMEAGHARGKIAITM